MKAIVFECPGEASEVLALREVEPPRPGAGEVLVAVEARPVMPADLSFVRGTYRVRPRYPQVAGLSGAGRVVVAGEGVALQPGTRVAFRSPGAWAERVAVPVERTFVAPADVALEDAAQFALNPVTAWGLLDVAAVAAGDIIGLTAPTSSVSRLTRALAETRGIAAVEIGRDGGTPSAVDAIRARTGGAGLAALLDSVGGPLLGALFGVLRPGATIVAYGTMSNEPVPVHNGTLVYGNLTWKGFGIDRWLAGLTPGARAEMAAALWQAIRERRLAMPVHGRVALADFADGLRAAAVGGGGGKVLLV
jgi:NADPH:quinone reductase-like Zn-dependent oxidoreductase